MGSLCRVAYSDAEGVHSVEVTADTLFGAVAQAVVEFKLDKTVSNPPGPETEFTVAVLKKPVEHSIRLNRILKWSEPSTLGGPAEILRRQRVRNMLESMITAEPPPTQLAPRNQHR